MSLADIQAMKALKLAKKNADTLASSQNTLQGLRNNNIYIWKYSSTVLYVHVLPSGSKKWIRYHFTNHIDGAINVNVWRMTQIYLVDNPGFSPMSKLTSTSEIPLCGGNSQWEYAIQISGAPDFFGGYHGDEIMQTIDAKVDDDVVDIVNMPVNTMFACQRLQIHQTTIAYDPTNGTTQVANIDVRHIFTNVGLQVKFSINWLVSKSIITAYAGMLPTLRGSGLTTKMQFLDDTTVWDISTTSHPMPGKNTYGVYLWNDTNKLKFFVEFDSLEWFNNTYPLSAAKGMWVTNATQYNKVYPARINAGSESVVNGTVWKGSVRYKIVSQEY